jgi:hypothetical protein
VARGQTDATNTPDGHIAAAKAAAQQDHIGLFDRVCGSLTPAAQQAGRVAPAAQTTLARDNWHAEPVKVFDNLYFVGQTEYSAWAVTTSAGIILVDTIYDYSVEDEVVGGLRKLGRDPATITRDRQPATGSLRWRDAPGSPGTRIIHPLTTGICSTAATARSRSATWSRPTACS